MFPRNAVACTEDYRCMQPKANPFRLMTVHKSRVTWRPKWFSDNLAYL